MKMNQKFRELLDDEIEIKDATEIFDLPTIALRGVGEESSEKLAECGITRLHQLSTLDAKDVSKRSGIPDWTLLAWGELVRDLGMLVVVKTVKDEVDYTEQALALNVARLTSVKEDQIEGLWAAGIVSVGLLGGQEPDSLASRAKIPKGVAKELINRAHAIGKVTPVPPGIEEHFVNYYSPNDTYDIMSGSTVYLKGIGKRYARKLREADINTIGELATWDPHTIVARTEIKYKMVSEWTRTARHVMGITRTEFEERLDQMIEDLTSIKVEYGTLLENAGFFKLGKEVESLNMMTLMVLDEYIDEVRRIVTLEQG